MIYSYLVWFFVAWRTVSSARATIFHTEKSMPEVLKYPFYGIIDGIWHAKPVTVNLQ